MWRVRVLSALAFPEVWPGWRGNALIGDFHRDFLQPGAPVLTALTVLCGDARRRRAGIVEVRPRDPAGRDRHRALSPGLAREGARLALHHRAHQGRRAAGQGELLRRRLCPRRRHRRGRAGGARDLSRPGLAGGGGTLCPAPLLACLPADGAGRRPRCRSRPDGAHEDAAHLVPRSISRRSTANGAARASRPTIRRCCS